jgi:hypothetical protein
MPKLELESIPRPELESIPSAELESIPRLELESMDVSALDVNPATEFPDIKIAASDAPKTNLVLALFAVRITSLLRFPLIWLINIFWPDIRSRLVTYW